MSVPLPPQKERFGTKLLAEEISVRFYFGIFIYEMVPDALDGRGVYREGVLLDSLSRFGGSTVRPEYQCVFLHGIYHAV